jgi:hypothetical protein
VVGCVASASPPKYIPLAFYEMVFILNSCRLVIDALSLRLKENRNTLDWENAVGILVSLVNIGRTEHTNER